MRSMIKAAVIALGAFGALAAAPASAQTYDSYPDDSYADPYADNGYDQGDYGPPPGYDDAYGAPYDDGSYDQASGYGCDPYYGCPDDYADLPYYDGEVYYDGSWLNGPFFYRDYGGGRQYWIHGGWHGGQYRGGNFRSARGRDWYSQHRNFAGGNRGYRGGYNSGARNYGNYNTSNYRAFRGTSSFNATPTYQGRTGWQGRSGNGGGNNWQSRRSFQPQAQAQQTHSWGGGGWHGNGQARQSAPQNSQPQQHNGGGGRGHHH